MNGRLHPTTQRVVDSAKDAGVDIDIKVFPEGTKTSADAAAAAGCPLSAIAKSLVFVVEGDSDPEPVIAVLSGDHRLDTTKLASAAGGTGSRRATLDEARLSRVERGAPASADEAKALAELYARPVAELFDEVGELGMVARPARLAAPDGATA